MSETPPPSPRTRGRTLQRVFFAFGMGATFLSLPACRRDSADRGGFPRAETYYVAGRQWGEPSSFNPLNGNPDWPVANSINLVYETLLSYNSLTGKMEPLLAESYKTTADTVEATLNAKARWNDGKPVTAWDVKYSFDLGKKYKALPTAPLWQYLSEIKVYDEAGNEAPADPVPGASYPRRVVFLLNKEKLNPLSVLDEFQNTRIVPRHSIEPQLAAVNGDIDAFLKLKFDKDAVSSGPYKLHSYNGEKVATIRDDNYWGNAALHGGKLPAVKYVVHPIFKGNDAFSIALRQGNLDASSTFVPRIWLKNAKGVHSWMDESPYFISASIPMLLINHNHKPLGDVHYRRAMAFAINYKDIRELAVSGYSDPLRPGLILPFGLESKFFNEEDAKKYGTWFDPARAKDELKQGGFTPVFNSEGELVETRDANGQKVPTVYIKSPAGWSDWESIVRIAVQGMRAVGIDARERFVDGGLFWNALFQGDFDLIMNTPNPPPSPSKPWSRFEAILTTQDLVPEGEKMYKNMGRYNDPKSPKYIARIDELLAKIPSMSDADAMAGYRELNVLFMKDQPTIPLVYRADAFYEFSNKHWANMPTAKNPYLPPLIPGDRLGTDMLWKITPVAQN